MPGKLYKEKHCSQNKMYVLIQVKNRTTSNFNLNQGNPYSQYIQNKIKNKLRMKAVSQACFKLEKKATRGVIKNKNNLINVIGDKFTLCII